VKGDAAWRVIKWSSFILLNIDNETWIAGLNPRSEEKNSESV